MKYGVNLMVWTIRVGKEHEALLARIREWGFDGGELLLSPQEPQDIPLVKRTLDRMQLAPRTLIETIAIPDLRVLNRNTRLLNRSFS
jgi:hypothetical protein